MALIQISKNNKERAPDSRVKHPFSIVLIDKFFLLGAIAGLFGSLILGIYVWLMRSGLVLPDVRYHSLRSFHATMQFYLFLTPFILGFLLQSGSKLLELEKPLPRMTGIILPLTITGAIFMLFYPQFAVGTWFIATACLLSAFQLSSGFIETGLFVKLRFAFLAILGLVSLGLGVFFDLGFTANAILLFWFGIISIIFATAQQFIAGIFGGMRRGKTAFGVFLLLYITAGIFLALNTFGLMSSWRITSFLMLCTISSFLYAAGSKAILSNLKNPLGFAFFTAFLWALIGAALIYRGELYLDTALHAWGIGFAVTLIIAISIRLISWISENKILSPFLTFLVLVLWQFVAFTRTFQLEFQGSRWMVWFGACSAICALTIWGGAILCGAFSLIKKQFLAFQKTGFFKFNNKVNKG